MILGASLAKMAHLDTYHTVSYMFFPLACHSIDLISLIIGQYFVRAHEERSTNK